MLWGVLGCLFLQGGSGLFTVQCRRTKGSSDGVSGSHQGCFGLIRVCFSRSGTPDSGLFTGFWVVSGFDFSEWGCFGLVEVSWFLVLGFRFVQGFGVVTGAK